MENEIVEMPFEIVESEKTSDEILKSGYKAINFSELPAYGLAGSELMNLVNFGPKAGGEGLYKVTFRNGVNGTLSKFKNENAFLGSVIGKDGITQARLTPVSIDPEQAFMALALIGIEMKLNQIVEMQTQMFNFLQAKEEAKIVGNMQMLNEAIESFKYNRDIPEFVSQKLVLLDSIKSDSQKSIALYKKQIVDTKNSLEDIHFVRDANQKAGEINRFLAVLHGAYYVLVYATFFETYLTGNFQSENLENIKKSIREYTKEYEDLFSSCKEWITNEINSSINLLAAPALKMTDILVEKVVKPLPMGFDKIYKNDSQLYISAEEQIKKIEPYENLEARVFCDEIDRLDLFHNKNMELYVDDANLYLDFEEKLVG